MFPYYIGLLTGTVLYGLFICAKRVLRMHLNYSPPVTQCRKTSLFLSYFMLGDCGYGCGYSFMLRLAKSRIRNWDKITEHS